MRRLQNIEYWYDQASGRELIICRDSTVCYPRHNHVSVSCLGWLLAGSLALTLGGAEVRLRPGQMFFVPPYLPHQLTADAPYTLLTVCLPSPPAAPAAGWAEPGLWRIKRQLETSPELPWSLAEMASAAHLSKYHFLRCFKQAFGLTPHQFQVQNRVRGAQRLLRQGVGPLDAALRSGFFDQSHFSRHFVRQLGLTPLAYQAACRSF